MKTKEFIRRVEELGYFINEYAGYYEITDVDENPIAVISETNFLQLSTNYSKWYELSEIDKKELFDLLIEYARTPIEDREEEKKFFLKHKFLTNKQFMKFIEEVFEFKTELDMFEYSGDILKPVNLEHVKDEMGDIFVTLIILCEQIGIDPEECLSMAYEKIKGRSGRTINGTFIKEEDLIDE
ncbi:MAG: MazG nucleotide pyrophosphohydrolase domain-containing protein [Peptoniphilaceae bacterium]|nr:MazG nucleotide pyrophosphohydrolase domain-containing protein [Peptoniphilaceae bacterium]